MPAAGALQQRCPHRPRFVVPASRTTKTLRPAELTQILSTGLLGGETRLELGQIPRIIFHFPDPTSCGHLSQVNTHLLENRGQLDRRVAFYLPGRDKQIYFTREGITFRLPSRSDAGPGRAQAWAAKMIFLAVDPDVRLHGVNPAEARFYHWKSSRLPGDPDVVADAVKSYRGVRYEGLWPGIDLALSLEGNQLKYEFHVAPGADPDRIRWTYDGAETAVTTTGELEITTPAATFRDGRPWAYQLDGDARRQVEAAYYAYRWESAGAGAASRNTLFEDPADHGERVAPYGFLLGDYDAAKPLVIDPAVLIYAGFLGGSGEDAARGIAIDEDGHAYLIGMTRSTDAGFPATVGPQKALAGSGDVFVAKIDPSGTKLVFAGYLGGSQLDEGADIALDGEGNLYLTGFTWSADFPVVGGPDLTHNGRMDAFVAKISADGSEVLYSGFLGGVEQDEGRGIAVDRDGNAYLAGRTQSTAATFPAAKGPDLSHNGGNTDGFVAKVSADGSTIEYAGYIGGSRFDIAAAVAVDHEGHAYVTGYTTSNEESFPVVGGPQQTWSGSEDAFLAKVTPDGAGLVYSGYLGGLGAERGEDIALDALGNIYLAGFTTADNPSRLPLTVGPSLEFGGAVDALVAKIGPDGSQVLYAGYIGGVSDDRATSIAVDGLGNAYVGGTTLSGPASFPVLAGPDLTHDGGRDAFVAKVAASGAALHYAGYIGAFGNESVTGIAVDPDGIAYVSGTTTSPDRELVVSGPDFTPNIGPDAFVAKIGATILPESSVVNGASFALGAIAPGEIVSIFGSGLGPAEGEQGRLESPRRVATELVGVEVFFDGVPAPLFFVRADQINAQAPYSLDGKSETEVHVRFQDRDSERVEFAVAAGAPGIFAFPHDPGRAVVFNENGTLNSSSNPAMRGEVVVFFATGEGQTIPPGVDGLLAPAVLSKLPRPEQPVTVTIGRRDARVIFAGSAPNFAGLLQINARVPLDLGSDADLMLKVGAARSQPNLSLFAF